MSDIDISNNPKSSKRGKWKGGKRGGHHGKSKAHYTDILNSSGHQHSKIVHDVLNTGGKFIQLENRCDSATEAFQPHWRNYISLEKYEAGKFSLETLHAASNYFKTRTVVTETTDELFNFKRFFLDFNDLITNDILKERWPTIEKDLDESPDLVIGIFGLARYDLWRNEVKIRGSLPIIR